MLLTADEAGEWAFHCHLLYHMMAGMMNKVIVAKLDPSAMPPQKADPHAGHNMPAKQEKPAVDHSKMDHSKMGHDMPAMDHSKMNHDMNKAPQGGQHHAQ